MKILLLKNSNAPTVSLALMAVSNLSAATHYVSLESANPTPPYTNWATAATNIQDAVNVASTNDAIILTNGVYPGGVTVTNSLALLSVNGPQVTVIMGGGPSVSLSDGACMSGFTVMNGSVDLHGAGAGVCCTSTNAILINCVIADNHALGSGGGAYAGTLYKCILTGNSANGGGGACGSILYDCLLNRNWVVGLPGGFRNPGSPGYGGAASECILYNCTLAGNSDSPPAGAFGGGGIGGGAYNCTLYNCIAYFNAAQDGANYDSWSTLNYCCTTPLPTNGVGNVDADPLFVDTNG